jgi:tRNA modification GTPase
LLGKAKEDAGKIIIQVRKVIDASHMLQKAKEGVKIAIVGRPNVGKSTLINGLVKKDVAIVSEIPGTTRDLIEVTLNRRRVPSKWEGTGWM